MIVDQMGVVHVIQVQFLAHALLMHRLYHLIVLLDSLNEALIVVCSGIRWRWLASSQLICLSGIRASLIGLLRCGQ